MFALIDRHSGAVLGKPREHKEAAWVEAYERKLVMQGRMGPKFEHIELLNPGYEIKEVPASETTKESN